MKSINTQKLYKAKSIKDFKKISPKNAYPRELIKWPLTYITGMKTTKTIADEFIRRTDCFFSLRYYGNEHDFIKKAAKIVGMGSAPDDWLNEDKYSKEEQKQRLAKNKIFDKKWNAVDLYYLHTDRLSCSYVGGVYGIVDFDGNVCWNQNVGKWPSVKELHNEFKLIARNFPSLEFRATVYDNEVCGDGDFNPVVSFWIKEGKVTITEGVDEDLKAIPEPDWSACWTQSECDPHINEARLVKWAKRAKTYVK